MIALAFFKNTEGTYWECNSCLANVDLNPKEVGYRNLAQHVIHNHRDYEQRIKDAYQQEILCSGPMNAFVQITNEIPSDRCMCYYSWIDWVVTNHFPLQFVNNQKNRDYTRLDSICYETLRKYILILSEEVALILSEKLPNKFALMFDGWDNGHSEHYVAIYAIFPSHDGSQKSFMLAAQPLLDPTDHSAESHVDYIISTLECYKKSPDSILFLIGDNTNLNPAIADILNVRHMGCASHRLNLGVKSLLVGSSMLLDMINSIMLKLRTVKFHAR
jgi:hypothetical protein